MAFDDLKSLVNILLHVLVVDEMLFELLRQLGAESLDSVDLLGDSLPDLHYLLVDVPGKEVGSLSRVLSCFFDLFAQFGRQLL